MSSDNKTASAWAGMLPATRQRGPVMENGRQVIGKVASPPGQEATSRQFPFWVPDGVLVEVGQIVTVISEIAGQTITYQAMVDEVHRNSRRRGMGHEVDEADGDLTQDPPFSTEGMTYAKATVLQVTPPRATPPRERSKVFLATDEEARNAYEGDDVENPLTVGLIRNGGDVTAGPGRIDTDYLLGANGGHMNVNGAAGRGTKSSFLMFSVYMLLREARRQEQEKPSSKERLKIVPIIFNVKNFDLFYLDRASRRFDPQKHGGAWEQVGVPEPQPFEKVTYYAPQRPSGETPWMTQREGVLPYSWGLADLLESDLFTYLFSEEDANNDNFSVLLFDLIAYLADDRTQPDGSIKMVPKPDIPQTNLNDLLDWFRDAEAIKKAVGPQHQPGTIRKFHRRLQRIVQDSRGVLRRDSPRGNPLDVRKGETTDPQVIDLSTLAGAGPMARFVVAAVLQQVVHARTYAPVNGLKYLIVLDELNRFAPRSGRDPITKLIEQVAAEMRSQGVILFGAQQQASMVSERVIENAGIKALGKTSMLELSKSVWSGLSGAAKQKADSLLPSEKLVIQDNFREPLHVLVPFPAWAMRREEAEEEALSEAAQAEHDEFIDG